MNTYLAGAGALAFFVGLAHSMLGEILIFRRMRIDGVIPTNGGKVIGERHVRILWASWHVLTVFGWQIAFTLIWLSASSVQTKSETALLTTIEIALLAGSLLVLVGTKARHPGWAGLLGVALLTWLGQGA